MAREYFKNLPDTSTPLKAERLNGFLNGDEPIGELTVDGIIGGNLFDKTDSIKSGYYYSDTGAEVEGSNVFLQESYIKVKPSTKYTLSSSNTGDVFRFCEYSSNKTFITRQTVPNTSSITYTTSSNTSYVRISCRLSNINAIKMELGDTATPFIPFKKYGYNSIDSMGEIVVDDIRSKNLFDGWILYKTLNSTTGVESDNERAGISDYIPITFENDTSVYISGLSSDAQSFIGAYNSQKQFLGRTSSSYKTSEQVNKNSFTGETAQGTGDIAYLRIRQNLPSDATITVDSFMSLNTQVEYSNSITSYTKYKNFNCEGYNLWQNPSPTSEFAGQQVSLYDDIRNYKYYEVIYKISTSNNNTFSTGKIPTSSTTYLLMTLNYIYRRSITSIGSNGKTLVFADGGRYETYGSSTLTTMNNYTIPLQILAYK